MNLLEELFNLESVMRYRNQGLEMKISSMQGSTMSTYALQYQSLSLCSEYLKSI